MNFYKPLVLSLALVYCHQLNGQNKIVYKDSVVYRITFRDTTIYRYDTVSLKYFIQTDTVWASKTSSLAESPKKKKILNSNNWGIGPSVGAYYSPYHGFDLNIGFGVQYYFFSIPSFRTPHMGQRHKK